MTRKKLHWGVGKLLDSCSWASLQVINNRRRFVTLFIIIQFVQSGRSSNLGSSKQQLSPSFISRQNIYKEEIGDTALLLCKVKNLGSSIIVWKQPDRIISAGMGMIRKDRRMKLLEHNDGVNLQITNLDIDDAGNYICEVENEGEPILQTNQLQILVPPKIVTSHPGDNLTVKKDSSLKLSCNASGFPSPILSWQRKHQMLPSGEKSAESSILMFPSVSRSDTGTYICTADNGVGNPVTIDINLKVIYAPEIEVDKSWVHGGVGYESVISCIVHGDPQPNVLWYRETMVLDRNNNRMMEQFGIRHRLVIASVSEEDFGNYSCVAENELGKSRGFIEVSGHPMEPIITSSSQGMFNDRFNLSWTVDTYSEITGYRIIYRKHNVLSNPLYDIRSRWHNILITDIKGQQDSTIIDDQYSTVRHGGNYIFFALEQNTKYEVRIQVRNSHGWGQFSEEFLFSTRSEGDVPKELPVEVHSNEIVEIKNSKKELPLLSKGEYSRPKKQMIIILLMISVLL